MSICSICAAEHYPKLGVRMVGTTVAGNGGSAVLTPVRSRILAALLAAYPRPLHVSALADAAWPVTWIGDGPLDEAGNLKVHLCRIRQAVGRLGLAVHRVDAGTYMIARLD